MPFGLILSAIGGWRAAIPWLLVIGLGAYAAVTAYRLQAVKADYAGLQVAVATARAEATEAARAQEAHNATLAQQMELAHADASKAVDAAAASARDFARARGLWVKAACNRGSVPGQANAASVPADGATTARLDDAIADSLVSLAHDGDAAAVYAAACQAWALEVGRH